MEILVQLLIGGVLQGGIYALGAFGLSIIFGVLRVLNVAHGDFLMLGGLLTYWLYTTLGLPPYLAVAAVLPVFFLAGLVMERLFVRPIAGMEHHEFLVATILITLGISLSVEDVAAFSQAHPIKGIDYFLPPFRIGGVVVSSIRLLMLGLIVILTAGIHLFLRRAYVGKALRAVMEDREGAMLAGINIPLVSAVSFGLGTALTAVAGVFFVTLYSISPHIGLPLTLKYLAIIVLGGVGNLPGTLFGSLILGLAESLVAFYVGTEWSLTVAFILLITVLLVRPRGLLG
ncbi:MAG: branched-chain amino acid ABC transporter permease [Candidatus Rokubacteria bacterium]|nr:branched-chain amino acid ABC transporter permease [Candidatus Rokubacteria bacterium]